MTNFIAFPWAFCFPVNQAWRNDQFNKIDQPREIWVHFGLWQYSSIECLTKCTNQQSHQLHAVTKLQPKMYLIVYIQQTMRPIEIKTFEKSLTNCRANHAVFMIIICFYYEFHFFCFFQFYCLFPTDSLAKHHRHSQPKKTKFYNYLGIVIVNSSFGNRQLCWNGSKYYCL